MNTRNGFFKGWFVVILGMVLGVLIMPTAEAATYSGGSGILGDPYLISTSADLLTLSGTSADWSKQFLMLNDIDMTGVTTFTPIGNSTIKFAGVFDGGGHIIQNLVINLPAQNYVGVFGYVSEPSSEIKNLGIHGGLVTGYVSVGGLVGRTDYGTIKSCYVSLAVTGQNRIGGLIGDSQSSEIISCYATGAVTASATIGNAGGLMGISESDIVTSCYATGKVSGKSLGGLVGSCYYEIGSSFQFSFWDTETTEQEGNYSGKGLSTAQMKQVSIFQNAGWTSYDWVMADGEYPRLAWEGTGMPAIPAPAPVSLSGSGTEADPYLVNTPQDFALLSWHVNILAANILLTADIDCSGVTLFPIGDLGIDFTGIFNGAGHSITNAIIDSTQRQQSGIFSCLGMSGAIHDLHIINCFISGSACLGGLVGTSDGTITSCSATGSVTGKDLYLLGFISVGSSALGGLVGVNGVGTVTSCYASVTVKGTGNGNGGLVGYNRGIITSCYATGEVMGSGDSGGLVSSNNQGIITSCYAVGTVFNGNAFTGSGLVSSNSGILSCSFWNIETSGHLESQGGKGLTTHQMKQVSIFQNAGWSAYDWVMIDGEYPRLAWEGTGMPPIPAPAPVSLAGNGTEGDPYLVNTPEDFALLSWHIDLLDAHILLTADLDCGEIMLNPIGDLGIPFTGVFDGMGHVINNAVINRPQSPRVAVFASVGQYGEIHDFGTINCVIVGGTNVGGLVGYNDVGTVTSCYSVGGTTVTEGMKNGGLIGYSNGTVEYCYSTGEITGGGESGGLIGYNDGTVTRCYSTVKVTGTAGGIGGLIGYCLGTVTSSYATGEVLGADNVGGLFGFKLGSVTSCYATGMVTGLTEFVGGIIGQMGEGTVIACYATGKVTGSNCVGGLVGNNGGALTSSYATGMVAGDTNLGGLVGLLSGGSVDTSFWDTTTGGPDNGYGTGLPTSQMKQRATFESVGWDFVNTWYIFDNLSYPNLTGIPMPIDSIESLQALAYASGGSFLLTRDIDARVTSGWSDKLGEPGFTPIGTAAEPFYGTLEGNGHRIFGLHINRPALDGVGLFGHIGASGIVRGVGLNDITITGGNQTGGLVGVNVGTIDQCYVQGSVSGIQEVGGLVGVNSGTVTETFAAATVQPQIVGGAPPQLHGGLVGADVGGNVTESFWDTDVSGIFFSGGGIGAQTSVLHSQDTFMTAGWDMTDTWAMTNGLTYPYFRNSVLARVVTGPAQLINADSVDIIVESFMPGVFVTVGGGAYPAWHRFDTASQASITVSLKQEAINELIVSVLSQTGVETTIARYQVFESSVFPDIPTQIAALQLSPFTLSLAEKDSHQFICVATFTDGTTAAVTPVCNWNVSGGTITAAGLYTHGLVPGQVQALLHTENGWASSNAAVVTTSKGGDDKAGTGLVSGVLLSHYTGLGLPDANVTVYNVYSPGVAAQYGMYDSLGNYLFFIPEGIYHFEGVTAGFRSETVWGGRLLSPPILVNPGPPEVWSLPEYSGQVKSDRPLQYNFELRPNDAQAPWVYYVEPPASCTVKEPLLVVTAINADKYSELSTATFTLNSNPHSVLDNISTTGFYRNTWSLELGLNTLRLYTVDTEGNASERSIEVIYDPDYDPSGYVPPDPDGPPATDCVAMALTSPRNGMSVRGNAVTLYAEALGGDLGAVAAVSFEARGSGTGNAWVILGVTLAAPHALVWDTTLYTEGSYQLRAVAISQDGCVDSAASVIDVAVASGAPYFQRVEMGTHYLTAPVSATTDTLLTLWDGTRFARITVPAGAIAANDVLTAFFPDAGLYTPALTTWQQDAGLYLDVSFQNHTGDFLGGKHATLEVGYPDSNGDDLLDATGLRVPLLQLRYLPTPTSSFVGLPFSFLSRGNHCITGETSHFSTFGIVEEQPAPPLNLLTDTLPNGFVGLAYTELLAADGGEAPYTWSVSSGTLPPGLNINGNSLEGTPTAAGDYSFTLQVADVQSPPYTVTRSFAVTIFDADQPTVTVEYAVGQQGNASTLPIRWAITFSEPVTGFDTGDITIEGTASKNAVYAVTGSGAVYQLEITTLPYDGALRPHVAAGGAQSVATGAPCVASSKERWVWMDRRAPMATITSVYSGLQEYGVSGPIVVETLPIIFQLTFDEYVTGLDASDVGFAETIPGLTYEVTGSAKSYTLTITNIDNVTTVTPSLLSAAAVDMAGNGVALTPYTGREVQYIPPALPSVNVNQQTGQADPTNGLPIFFDIVFSAPVVGFDAAAVTPIGTALNPLYTVTGSGATYTLTVTGADSDGTVAFRIPETVNWLASTSLDNGVTLSRSAPGITLGSPSSLQTNQGPVSIPVLYTDASIITLAVTDVLVDADATVNTQVLVTGTGNQSRIVTLYGLNGYGNIRISVAPNTAANAVGISASGAGPSQTILVGAPTADFYASPTTGVAPLTVNFSDLSDPGYAPVEHRYWDFGDGTTSDEQSPTHIYDTEGTYSVSLTVTTSVGSDTKQAIDHIEVIVAMPIGGMAALAILATLLATCAAVILQGRPKRIRKM
jgi:hypothetical protein